MWSYVVFPGVILKKKWSYVVFPGIILTKVDLRGYSGNYSKKMETRYSGKMLKKMEIRGFSLCKFKTANALS